MMPRLALAFAFAFTVSAPLAAQTYPLPDLETPRVQTAAWSDGTEIVLTALPDTTLTVMLEPGEIIRRATLTGDSAWQVAVSAETDSFQVKGGAGAAPTTLQIDTDYRRYDFKLEADVSLQAAYLVRIVYGPGLQGTPPANFEAEPIEDLRFSYRLRGDKSVRPASIRDNGKKTVIEYAPGQALPAVFAIGPTGDEEVVDGYMRGGRFVIDRVHERLVFRIDKEKATARRNSRRDGS